MTELHYVTQEAQPQSHRSPGSDLTTLDVGIQMKRLRKMKGWSQRELSKRGGVPNSTVSMIEQNRVNPTLDTLEKLLDALGLTTAQLFTQSPQSNYKHFPQAELLTPNLPSACSGQIQMLSAPEIEIEIYQHDCQRWLMALDYTWVIALQEGVVTLLPGEGLWLGRGEAFALQPHRNTSQLLLIGSV